MIKRHDGSISGLMKCNAARRTRNEIADKKDICAAVFEIADNGFGVF